MTQEQREEIESALQKIDSDPYAIGSIESSWAIKAIANFARQQLNLRVDGEKLLRKLTDAKIIPWALIVSNDEIQALVMECLTTEEKE